MRAAVELAKDWRTDKYLRNLEALMIVADKDVLLVLTGNGDVLEPEGGIAAIGSGGNYALAAARALSDYEDDPEKIARRAMAVAAEVCVFTNDRVTLRRIWPHCQAARADLARPRGGRQQDPFDPAAARACRAGGGDGALVVRLRQLRRQPRRAAGVGGRAGAAPRWRRSS